MSEKVERKTQRQRVPIGGHQTKLQLSEKDNLYFKESGYVPRWFNDKDGRVEAALAAGYEFVRPGEAPSIGVTGLHEENSDLNSKVSKVVSRSGDPIRAYLMKIPKEFYDEDQSAKEAINAKVDERLRPVDKGGQSIESGYTPSD